jgi:hypothetical protein
VQPWQLRLRHIKAGVTTSDHEHASTSQLIFVSIVDSMTDLAGEFSWIFRPTGDPVHTVGTDNLGVTSTFSIQ